MVEDVVPQSGEPAGFEASLAQLEAIVRELEAGTLTLEASLARFEEAMGHLRTCYRVLEQAEQKIEILTSATQPGQEPRVAPFDAAATLDPSAAVPSKPGRRPPAGSTRSSGASEEGAAP